MRRETPVMIKAGALLAVALAVASPAARAQTYPSRQITLVIPFTPGGSNDLVARAVGRNFPRRGGSRW
jgi:tripartite-type tricarboxylate transporter receptor subunit TctC